MGLDALSDPEIATAVGNAMFADLVSVAGHIYKFGINDGLPNADEKSHQLVCIVMNSMN